MEIIYEKTKGQIPLRLSLGKQNDLNQVVVSSGFSENKGLGWVFSLAGSKTWFWSFLLRNFREKKKAICEFQKNLTFKARPSAKHLLTEKWVFFTWRTKSHFHINSFAPSFWNRGLIAYPPIRSQKLLGDAFRLQFPSRLLSGELHYWSGFDAAK